jgi:toxin HigB-1
MPNNVIIDTEIPMIESFGNRAARQIWEYGYTKDISAPLYTRALVLLKIMHAVNSLAEIKHLEEPPSVRLHKLKGDRRDQWSLTIELPWAITFRIEKDKFVNVSIENYHRG